MFKNLAKNVGGTSYLFPIINKTSRNNKKQGKNRTRKTNTLGRPAKASHSIVLNIVPLSIQTLKIN